MSPLLSRVLVALAGLPVVLGVVWLGGWWLFALVALVTALALHEYFSLVRPHRPLVLAGYLGAAGALLGAELGGPTWMIGGFAATLAVAFVLHGISSTRAQPTVAIGATVLGGAWIGLGFAHVLLVRDLPEHGRLAAFTVLLAVWASDTIAYFAGKLFGRHRMTPVLSPGKTWEGFAAGTLAAIFVAFIALYRTGFVDGWRSIVLGGVVALAAALGDLFESAIKRDVGAKDSGTLLGGHGGMLDRADALLFASVASFYAILALR